MNQNGRKSSNNTPFFLYNLWGLSPLQLFDTEDLVDFFIKNYSHVDRIVEVGIGAYPHVAIRLKKLLPSVNVIVTDIDKVKLATIKKEYVELEPVYDDIFEPQWIIYAGADLLYSIRPPPEMIPEIMKMALNVGSDLLIRPFFNDEGDYEYPKLRGWRLTNYKRAIFYLLKK